jgi:uncharacterized protein (DUF927 family)
MFPGYLCLHQQASRAGRLVDLPFPYFDFFDAYLKVRDGTKPYLVPFTQAVNPDDTSLWLNENVSGTYAPSSLRSTAPLLKVAEIEEGGHNARWKLKQDHWRLARHHLCDGGQLPVESLAAFLLRDYAFEADEPNAYTVVSAFASEFGFELSGEPFAYLFETGDSEITSEVFELYD